MSDFLNLEWQQLHSLRIDVNNMFLEPLTKATEISVQDIKTLEPELKQMIRSFSRKRSEMAWRELPYNQKEFVSEIKQYASEAAGRFENFVVLGIGGSALGPMAVQQALNHQYYNELSKEQRQGWPRFYVLDNIDPERFMGLLDIINPTKTLFNVITKSGGTSETMSQFMIVRSILKERLGEEYANNLVATTDRANGNLIKIAQLEGYKTFYVPEGVGGRFSELCPVGLLPAAMSGVDIEQLLAGAAFMDNWISKQDDVWQNPAYLRAVLQKLAMDSGRNISVMMPYTDALKCFADWYAQLWAESLGKRFKLDGTEIFAGQTPVRALGATDQHSQIQLYIEGPYDKVVTLLAVDDFRQEVTIPRSFEDFPGLAFLGGKSMNSLLQAERQATEYALQKAGRINNTIYLPKINEFTIGQLIYLFEVETAFAGELMGINAFDQPGVEEGKIAAYALMDRPGYEQKKLEFESGRSKQEKYVLQQNIKE